MTKSISLTSRAVAMLALLGGAPKPAVAQERSTTWGFVSARYDTRSSDYIYSGYGWRRGFGLAGVLHNPRTGDAEIVAGLGATFMPWKGSEHWLAFAVAHASEGRIAKVYWLPTIRTGVVTSRATVTWATPLNDNGVSRLSISPLSITAPFSRRVAAGVAVDVSAKEGARSSAGVGPELRIKLPGAGVGVDVLRDVTSAGWRLRVFFASAF